MQGSKQVVVIVVLFPPIHPILYPLGRHRIPHISTIPWSKHFNELAIKGENNIHAFNPTERKQQKEQSLIPTSCQHGGYPNAYFQFYEGITVIHLHG